MKSKFSVVILSLILVTSIFAISIFAQENETENNATNNTEKVEDIVSSDEVEVVEGNVEEEVPEIEETEEIEEIKEVDKRAIFGITLVTVGEGFVMTNDKSNAEFFRGVWMVKKFVNRSEAENLENVKIKSKEVGFVVIGVAEEKKKFRLEKKESSEESVNFDLIDKTGNVVGNMEIKPKRYERITLWFGTLTLNSGNYTGTWDVTAVSKTRVVKPRIEKPNRANIFAFRKRREAKIKEKIQEKMFEREGMKGFVEATKVKDFSKLGESQRFIRVNREEKIRRIEEARKIGEAGQTGIEKGIKAAQF